MNQQRLVHFFLLLFASALAACKPTGNTAQTEAALTSSQAKTVYFDVNLYSYLDRPIFDVMLNGKFIGLAGGQPHRGRGGLVTGVAVPLGEQTITWRWGGPRGTPGNGETMQAVNKPILHAPADKETYLGVHIYPDNTVELVPEKFWPNKTEKGEAINRQWELEHGQ